jgi:hypothetical protein
MKNVMDPTEVSSTGLDSIAVRAWDTGQIVWRRREITPLSRTTQDRYEMQRGILLSIQSDQQWFWSSEWLAGEQQATADIAAGNVTRHARAEDFFAALEEQID